MIFLLALPAKSRVIEKIIWLVRLICLNYSSQLTSSVAEGRWGQRTMAWDAGNLGKIQVFELDSENLVRVK